MSGLDARWAELLGRHAENAVSFHVRYADFKKFLSVQDSRRILDLQHYPVGTFLCALYRR